MIQRARVNDDPRTPATIEYEAPSPGNLVEIADGVLWLRLPLPFRLNHVNVYLVEEGDGFAAIDVGLGDAPTREIWEGVLATLAPRRLTRIVGTHFHPDHIGIGGWLTEHCGVPLHMSATEFLLSRSFCLDPKLGTSEHYREFYLTNGLDEDTVELVTQRGNAYLRVFTGLPSTFRRLVDGDVLKIGARRFGVLTGGGHAPEQVMLASAEDRLFFSADQVLARISPNVSVWPDDPFGNPLGHYLKSLARLKREVPGDVLVLPGHGVPFHGLHARLGELEQHHEQRCAEIIAACRLQPMSAADLVPAIFPRPLDPQQRSFAFSEVLAHINLLVEREVLAWSIEGATRRCRPA